MNRQPMAAPRFHIVRIRVALSTLVERNSSRICGMAGAQIRTVRFLDQFVSKTRG